MQNLEAGMQILAIDSDDDCVTEIICNYRNEHVYPYLESKGFGLIRCQGKSACRKDVVSEVDRDDIVYITGAGHGNDTKYTGDCRLPVFEVGNYHPAESDGKIVHFLSCGTAAELGPDFVKNGCRAYFGYSGIFTFPVDFSDIFLECDSEIDLAFADGLTAEEVFDHVSKYYDQKISELENEGVNDIDIDEIISLLERNRACFCAPSVDSRYGDRQARLL